MSQYNSYRFHLFELNSAQISSQPSMNWVVLIEFFGSLGFLNTYNVMSHIGWEENKPCENLPLACTF